MPVNYTCDICGEEVIKDSLYNILFHRPHETTLVRLMVDKDVYLCDEHISFIKKALDKFVDVHFSTQESMDDEIDWNYHTPITDYWLKYYLTSGMCSLCGQTGIIHTEGIRAPSGKIVGRSNYCICPNGQSLRKNNTKETE